MLQRLIGVLKLDIGIIEEIEHDPEALGQAAMVVAIAAVCETISQVHASHFSVIFTPIGSILQAFIGWYIASWVTYKVGTAMFQAEATHGEMLRVMGYAQIPAVFSLLGAVPSVGGLINLVVAIWSLVVSFICIRQGLDVSNWKTFLTLIMVGLVYFAVILGIGLLIGLLGAVVMSATT